MLWLAISLAALLVLQLLYYACYYLVLVLQLSYYTFTDERCVTLGWLVDHHWPSRQFMWKGRLWDFCSVSDFPQGVVKGQVRLLPRWLGWIVAVVAVVAVTVDAWRVRRAAVARADRTSTRWFAFSRPVVAGAALVLLALLVPDNLQLQGDSSIDEISNAQKILRLEPPFIHWGGLAYFARAPEFSEIGDSNDDGRRSPVLLFENNVLLGPAHSMHQDIVRAGGGRFSHWGPAGGVVFSTKNGDSPETSGKRYWLVLPKREATR